MSENIQCRLCVLVTCGNHSNNDDVWKMKQNILALLNICSFRFHSHRICLLWSLGRTKFMESQCLVGRRYCYHLNARLLFFLRSLLSFFFGKVSVSFKLKSLHANEMWFAINVEDIDETKIITCGSESFSICGEILIAHVMMMFGNRIKLFWLV